MKLTDFLLNEYEVLLKDFQEKLASYREGLNNSETPRNNVLLSRYVAQQLARQTAVAIELAKYLGVSKLFEAYTGYAFDSLAERYESEFAPLASPGSRYDVLSPEDFKTVRETLRTWDPSRIGDLASLVSGLHALLSSSDEKLREAFPGYTDEQFVEMKVRSADMLRHFEFEHPEMWAKLQAEKPNLTAMHETEDNEPKLDVSQYPIWRISADEYRKKVGDLLHDPRFSVQHRGYAGLLDYAEANPRMFPSVTLLESRLITASPSQRQAILPDMTPEEIDEFIRELQKFGELTRVVSQKKNDRSSLLAVLASLIQDVKEERKQQENATENQETDVVAQEPSA